MRKTRAAAAETRVRIVEAAAAEFRANGIGHTGLSGLMAAAGLTNGGFYKHFASKDQVVAEACELGLAELSAGLVQAMDGRGGATPAGRRRAAADAYLSPAHRDHPGQGCPFAALGSELARGAEPVRRSATDGLRTMVALLAGGDDPADRGAALVALSAMVGAMTLARIADDAALSDEILLQMRRHLAHASEPAAG